MDNNGAYLHSGTSNRSRRDANFQGFGRFLTGTTGEYYFRTVKPVPYPGRTPHVHFKVKVRGRSDLGRSRFLTAFSRESARASSSPHRRRSVRGTRADPSRGSPAESPIASR